MKRIRFYSIALIVVLLSQLCGPTLVPWRPPPGDVFFLLLAWVCAVAFAAYSARRGALPLALIAAFTQVLLIRYQYVLRFSFAYASESDSELLLQNLVLIGGYVLVTGGLGKALANSWPVRIKTASVVPNNL